MFIENSGKKILEIMSVRYQQKRKKKIVNATVHASTNKRPNTINQSGKTTQRNREGNMKTDLKEFFSYRMEEANVSWI